MGEREDTVKLINDLSGLSEKKLCLLGSHPSKPPAQLQSGDSWGSPGAICRSEPRPVLRKGSGPLCTARPSEYSCK